MAPSILIICNVQLWKERLHLVESRKIILANNYWASSVTTVTKWSAAYLEVLQQIRLTYPHIALIGYSSISSLWNKIIDLRIIIETVH